MISPEKINWSLQSVFNFGLQIKKLIRGLVARTSLGGASRGEVFMDKIEFSAGKRIVERIKIEHI